MLMHNALDPARLSPDERLDEVAEILAVGLRRFLDRKNMGENKEFGEVSLDFTGHRSGHGLKPKRNGEGP